MIQLWTLGRLDLRAADGSELRALLTQPKRFALLAYLALHNPRGFITREHLLALFWPELDSEHARSALNRALYFVRRTLGQGVVLSRGDEEVGLSWDHFWCDAAAFENAASSAAREAVELYHGDLLKGFHVSDARGFEEWLDAERERLRRIAQRSGWTLAAQEERAGNRAGAAQAARWAAQRAPYDEASVQRLLSLLDRCGDRAGAIQTYDEFARRLNGDLELEPAPETRALIEAIRARQQQNGVHASADTVADAAPAPEVRAETQIPARSRRWYWRRSAILAGTALVVSAGGTALFVRPRVDPQVVLVSAIENRSGDPALDAVARSVTELISRRVADAVEATASPVFRPGNRVVRESGRAIGAGTRVTGELYSEAGKVVYRVRLIDAVRGGTVWPIPAIQARSDSADAALRELAQRVAGGVAVLLDPGLAPWSPAATSPPTYEAFLTMFVAAKVVPPFTSGPVWERVYALDTTFTYALFRAARFLRPGNALRSDSILKRLDGRREHLPQPQVFLLDAMLAEFAGNRTAKYEALKRAAALAPARFLTDFAASASELYRPRETLHLLDRLVKARPDYRDSVRYVSWRIDLYHHLGEHRRETVLARKARRQRPDDLRAMYDYARALAATHRTAEVMALIDSALSAPRDDYFTPGSIMWITSEELRAHGEPDAAAAVARRMLDWYESSRATEIDTTWHSHNLAFAYYANGRWSESRAIYEQINVAKPSYRANTYGYLGAIAARSNDRSGALRYIALLDSLHVPAEGPRYEALISRARISALLGDGEGALRALRDAVGGQGMDLHADADFAALRDDPRFRDFCRAKG